MAYIYSFMIYTYFLYITLKRGQVTSQPKIWSNQNEICNTCGPIMNTTFDANLMTSSLIVYAKSLVMKN